MRKGKLRALIIKGLQRHFRGDVLLRVSNRMLKEFTEDYKLRHNVLPDESTKSKFVYAMLSQMAKETDEILAKTADEILRSYSWFPWTSVTILSVLLSPGIVVLSTYAIRHFAYLNGNEDAFANIGYEGLAGTVISVMLLFLLLTVNLINEIRQD